MSYALRIPIAIVLVALSARALLAAPLWLMYALGVPTLAYLIGDRLAAHMRTRRSMASAGYVPDVDWIDCGERRELGGITWKCSDRKGHKGPHEASPSVEWE